MYVNARGFTAEQKNCGKSGLGRRGPWALDLLLAKPSAIGF